MSFPIIAATSSIQKIPFLNPSVVAKHGLSGKIIAIAAVIFLVLSAAFIAIYTLIIKKSKVSNPQSIPLDANSKNNAKQLENFFNRFGTLCGKLEDEVLKNHDKNFVVDQIKTIRDQNTHDQILGLLNEIIVKYEQKYNVPRYWKKNYGDLIPSYFANDAGGQTDVQRKYLSLLGIRNLLKFGPEIVDEFREKSFIGGVQHYDSHKGINKLKAFTGTLVDLDTEFDAKNDAEALKLAQAKIVQFGDKCGLKNSNGNDLTAGDVQNHLPTRKLKLPNLFRGEHIHKSHSHTDRSNHGIWKYTKPGSFKPDYYVNVPNLGTVLSATLMMPYMLAELLYLTKEYSVKQNDTKILNDFYQEFFTTALSDKCMNEKADKLNVFYISWKEKLTPSKTVEEIAHENIVSGKFGSKLQSQDPKQVIEKALTRIKLIDFVMEKDPDDDIKYLPDYATWVIQEAPKIKKILLEEQLWENALYRTDDDPDAMGKYKDYFLLNENSFNEFIKSYYVMLQTLV